MRLVSSTRTVHGVDTSPHAGSRAARRGEPAAARRSSRAHEAVLGAAIELFEAVGYARLTIDAIASRAGVSKATIYRWWPNKAAVVMEALLTTVEPDIAFPDSGSVRQDLVEQAGALARLLTERPLGQMVLALLGQAQDDADLASALREGWQQPRRDAGREVLQRAVDRGELRAECDLELVLDGVYGPIYLRLLFGHAPLDGHDLERLVDQALHSVTRRHGDRP